MSSAGWTPVPMPPGVHSTVLASTYHAETTASRQITSALAYGRKVSQLVTSRRLVHCSRASQARQSAPILDDIVTQVEKLSRAVDRTVHRVGALRVGVIGLLAALARDDPVSGAKIISDVILVLDATIHDSELQGSKAELDELG